jgi:hypothetical protein
MQFRIAEVGREPASEASTASAAAPVSALREKSTFVVPR